MNATASSGKDRSGIWCGRGGKCSTLSVNGNKLVGNCSARKGRATPNIPTACGEQYDAIEEEKKKRLANAYTAILFSLAAYNDTPSASQMHRSLPSDSTVSFVENDDQKNQEIVLNL